MRLLSLFVSLLSSYAVVGRVENNNGEGLVNLAAPSAGRGRIEITRGMYRKEFTTCVQTSTLDKYSLEKSLKLPGGPERVKTVISPDVLAKIQEEIAQGNFSEFKEIRHRPCFQHVPINYGDSVQLSASIASIVQPRHLRHLLQTGRWDRFNRLLEDAVFNIPDQVIETSAMGYDYVTATFTNIKCSNLQVKKDMTLTSELRENKVDVHMSVSGLEIDCSLAYEASAKDKWFPTLSTDGKAAISGSNNNFNVKFSAISKDIKKVPPHDIQFGSCTADLNIDLDLSGGKMATILNALSGLFKSKLESVIETELCEMLEPVAEEPIEELLAIANEFITDYGVGGRKTKGLDVDVEEVENELLASLDSSTHNVVGIAGLSKHLGGLAGLVSGAVGGLTGGSLGDDQNERKAPGITNILSKLLPAGGTISMSNLGAEVYAGHDPITETAITLKEINITGLDTTQIFNLSLPSNLTIHNIIRLENLRVDAALHLKMTSCSKDQSCIVTHAPSAPRPQPIEENLVLSLTVKDLMTDVIMMIAIADDKFGRLNLQNLTTAPVGCVMQTMEELQLIKANASVGTVEKPFMSGFIDDGLDGLITGAVDAVYTMMNYSFTPAVPGFISSTITNLTKGIIDKIESPECPLAEPIDPMSIIDLTTNEIFQNVSQTLKRELDASQDSFKNLIKDVTVSDEKNNRILRINGTLFENDMFYIGNIVVEGLDTFKEITLLEAESPTVIFNKLEMGKLEIAVDVKLNIDVGGVQANAVLTMALKIENLELIAAVLMAIDEYELMAMQIQQLQYFDCWLSTLRQLKAKKLSFLTDFIGIDLKCKDCPERLAELDKAMESKVVREMITSKLQKMIKTFVEGASGPGGDEAALKMIEEAPRLCANLSGSIDGAGRNRSSQYAAKAIGGHGAELDDGGGMVFLGLGASLSVTVGLACCCYGIYFRRLKAKKKQLAYMKQSDEERASTSAVKKFDTVRLIWHETTPKHMKVLVPLLCALNIVCFIVGHFTVGASIDLTLNILGNEVAIPAFFTFSLGSSLADMWNAGSYALFFLIAIFSGLWPYTKVSLILTCFLISPETMRPKTRGKLLQALDALGKWSMIDLYVLILSMVAYSMEIVSPKEINVQFYNVQLIVNPVLGLYCFCIGACMALTINHIVIHYHRNSVAYDKEVAFEALKKEISSNPPESGDSNSPHLSLPNADGQRASWFDSGTEDVDGYRHQLVDVTESLQDHIFELEKGTEMLALRTFGKGAVIGMLVCAITFLLIGSTVIAWQFEILGLAGVARDIGEPGSSIMNFSVVNILSYMSVLADTPGIEENFGHWAGVWFLTLLYLALVFLIPLLQLVSLLFMWVYPLTLRRLKYCFALNEVLTAWSTLLVFLVSIIVALIEIGHISKFMVGSECDVINPYLAMAKQFGILNTNEAQCFYVHSRIKPGIWILMIAAINSLIACNVVLRLAESAIEDRENRIKGRPTDVEHVHGFGHFFLIKLVKLAWCVRRIDNEDISENEDFVNRAVAKIDKDNGDRIGSSMMFNKPSSPRRSKYDNVDSQGDSGIQMSSLDITVEGAEGGDNGKGRSHSTSVNLPPGWVSVKSPANETFYWNTLTGRTSFSVPST